MVPGYIFNLYVRHRIDESRWGSVQLEILNENYHDSICILTLDIDYARPVMNASSKNTTLSRIKEYEVFTSPIPTEWNDNEEPVFMPHVNLNPLPYAYLKNGDGLFGKSNEPKPEHIGITRNGIRYYPSRPEQAYGARNMLAGYDLSGVPFYVPKVLSIPQPCGYTVDGIPFYDAPTIIVQSGKIISPSSFRNDELNEDEQWEDLLTNTDFSGRSSSVIKRMEKIFLAKLCKSLMHSQPKIMSLLTANQNIFQMQPVRDWKPLVLESVLDPPDIQLYLKESIEVTHRKFSSFRVLLDPPSFEFCSVRTSTQKKIALRYKANRGDNDEREVFIATDPSDVFQTKLLSLRLSGEGVTSIDLEFFPVKMQSDFVTGGLFIIDTSGSRIASCKLLARRQGSFSISHASIDIGWTLPDKQKSSSLKVTNNSANVITIGISLRSDNSNLKDAPFKLPDRSFKLQGFESKSIAIIFEPKSLGVFTDTISILGPGGDVLNSKVSATAGIPIAIYPENYTNSMLGASILVQQRNSFVTKIKKKTGASLQFTEEEATLRKSIMSAQIDSDYRERVHTIDFGILSRKDSEVTRCVTFLNLGEESITLSIFSHSNNIKCPYLIRVPASGANTVAVKFLINAEKEMFRGNLNTLLEVACVDFENLPISVKGYVGQPLYFPVYHHVFFKPCSRLGEQTKLTISLINESQYDLPVSSFGLESNNSDDCLCNFGSSLPTSEHNEIVAVPSFGILPVTFFFSATGSGAFIRKVQLQLLEPHISVIPAVLQALYAQPKDLLLYGICIDPTLNPIKCLGEVSRWITNIEKQGDDEMFEPFTITTHPPPKNTLELEFQSDPYISDVSSII